MANEAKIEDIKILRRITDAGFMDCRKAILETKGDLKKAEALLIKQGVAKAEKKVGREAKQGVITSYIHANGKIGVLVEVNCETDFVARTDDFQTLVKEISMQIAAMDPKSVKELLKQEYIRDMSITIEELVKRLIGKVGENIVVKRFIRYELGEK